MRLRRFSQITQLAGRNAVRFRLQSILSALAACVGVAGVLISVEYSEGGRQRILDRFTSLGTNVITVSPQQSRAVGGRARTGAVVQTLGSDDYKAIKTEVDGIDASSATVSGSFRVRAGDLTKVVTVIGCEPEYFRIGHWAATAGTIFEASDVRHQGRAALLGYRVASDLFGRIDPTGRRVAINRVPFVVAGVLGERGQRLDAANEDEQVYLPLSTAMSRLMNVNFYSSIEFEIDDSAQMRVTMERVTALLRRRHKAWSPSADDFQVQNQKGLIDAQLTAFERLSFLIDTIALCTLMVSGLGIWGITWIAIRNRTREIGARRAVGATRSDILLQFLSEAFVSCALGCVVSLAVAYAVPDVLDRLIQQRYLFRWNTAVWNMAGAALLLGTFVVIAGIRATFVSPISALRAE